MGSTVLHSNAKEQQIKAQKKVGDMIDVQRILILSIIYVYIWGEDM